MTGKGKRRAPRAERPPPRDLSQPLEALGFTVGAEDDGARLDRFLGERLHWRSRTSIVELLGQGQVLVAGRAITKKAHRLSAGERVEVKVPPPAEEAQHEALGLALDAAILHDDPHLLAVAKPPGLVVHPVGRVRVNTLIQGLHWLYGHGPRRDPRVLPRMCHRLDRDTSGVMVVAKTLAARSALQAIFEGHRLDKHYEAVVVGRLAEDRGRIEAPIGPDPDSPVELAMTTRPDGAPSATRFRVIRRFQGHTHAAFELETGRQHQIRVHARELGHPVLLDPLYGVDATPGAPAAGAWPDEAGAVLRRQALHARWLAFDHPVTGARLELEAPLPEDFQALLAELDRREP